MPNCLTVMTSAFLFYDNYVLLIKRSLSKRIAPGMWAGIGGHVETSEFDDIKQSCLREIEEETGLLSAQITALDLRYIQLRQKENELRQHYFEFHPTRGVWIGVMGAENFQPIVTWSKIQDWE